MISSRQLTDQPEAARNDCQMTILDQSAVLEETAIAVHEKATLTNVEGSRTQESQPDLNIKVSYFSKYIRNSNQEKDLRNLLFLSSK